MTLLDRHWERIRAEHLLNVVSVANPMGESRWRIRCGAEHCGFDQGLVVPRESMQEKSAQDYVRLWLQVEATHHHLDLLLATPEEELCPSPASSAPPPPSNDAARSSNSRRRRAWSTRLRGRRTAV